jgi:hypothetical protein
MGEDLPVCLACDEYRDRRGNLNNRITDIEKLLDGLDLTVTMFRNATEKYKSIAAYFESKGFACDIYPFGSFSLGTVVRPYRGEEDPQYDLDFICCIHDERENTRPRAVKNSVKDKLVQNETYKKILCDKEWDKCWTMEYADVDGVGFNMDIVPATFDSEKGKSPERECAIVITNKGKNGDYNWVVSNPKAYRAWFNQINAPFLAYNREERRASIFEMQKKFYNTVEEIPQEMERSSLQRVVQLLKRHRDVYFLKAGESNKPISVIITTLVAQIGSEISPSIDFYALFEHVVRELQKYSKLQTLDGMSFAAVYHDKVRIMRSSNRWVIKSPVSDENLAESWIEDPEKAKAFFRWVDQLAIDFLDSMLESDERFAASMGNAFGVKYVQRSGLCEKYQRTQPKVISNPAKPWGVKWFL